MAFREDPEKRGIIMIMKPTLTSGERGAEFHRKAPTNNKINLPTIFFINHFNMYYTTPFLYISTVTDGPTVSYVVNIGCCKRMADKMI